MRYFYTDDANQVIGPIEKDNLVDLYHQGKIHAGTNLLPEGSEKWSTYGNTILSLPTPPTNHGQNHIIPQQNVISQRAEPSFHQPVITQVAETGQRCSFCYEVIVIGAKKCRHCGETLDPTLKLLEEHSRLLKNNQNISSAPLNGKSKVTAALLAIFLGGIGAHKFYLNQSLFGIIYLLFCWTGIPAIAGVIEGIVYLCSDDQTFARKYAR